MIPMRTSTPLRFVRVAKSSIWKTTGSRAISTATPQALPGWFKRMHATNEYNLPRLPVPQLSETIERYLESVRPLVSEKEWKEHAELAQQFVKHQGRTLQEQLLKRELSQAMGKVYPFSYIEADWDQMYLAARYESPVNVNPAYGLRDETETHLKGMIPRTAAMVRSMLKWWHSVKTSALEQDKNQCMFGFPRQFGTARIPMKERDVLESFPRSQHIVVLHNNQFYQVNVLSPDEKQLLSQSDVEQQLNEILNNSSNSSPVDVSMVTAQRRDKWADLRQRMIEYDPINKDSLRTIDSALFVLVLDSQSASNRVEQLEWQLHGHGRDSWFDKLQVRVQGDGHIGVNFEHSFSDGTVWNRWLHEVWHDMRETDSGFTKLQELPVYKTSPKPRVLSWKFSNNLIEDIKKAEEHAHALFENVGADFLEYTTFAKKDCKKWKWSPDGVAQMALQLAFHRAHGKNPAVYESCSTRSFLHGRTETIRSATPAAKAFVDAVATQASPLQQRELLVDAIQSHVNMAKMAQKGLGCDRHLTALSSIASTNGIKSLFLQHPIRAASTNFQLSTSNVTTPFLEYFCFGATVPHGYGVGYLIHENSINLSMTNFKDSELTDVTRYKKHLIESFDTIQQLAETSG